MRRLALLGHVVRLDANTPAHQILKQGVDVKSGHRPNAQWRRPPGRPRNCWLSQINNASLTGIRQSWRAAENHGHRGSSLRPFAAYALRWWWILNLCYCLHGHVTKDNTMYMRKWTGQGDAIGWKTEHAGGWSSKINQSSNEGWLKTTQNCIK